MTTTVGGVDVRIQANTSQLGAGLNRAKAQTQQFTTQVNRSLSNVSRGFAGLCALATRALGPLGAAGAVVALTSRVMDSTRRHVELANAILLTGNASRTTVRQVEDLSLELSRSTNRNIDEIRGVTAALVRQGVQAGDVMRDIINTASRLSSAGFGTFEQNVQRLTISMRQPRQALIDLHNEGIRFSEGTIEQVRRLTALGQAHRAHQVLLEALKTKTKDVKEQMPTLSGAMSDLFSDVALGAARALGHVGTLEEAIKRIVGWMRVFGDFVSGRADDARIRSRGVEQLKQDIDDLQTSITALQRGGGFGSVWRRQMEDLIAGPATNVETLSRALERFKRIKEELETPPIPERNPRRPLPVTRDADPARMFAQGDALDQIRRRLQTERAVLGMTDAQARAYEMIASLRERQIMVSPKIAEGLRREIIELENIKNILRTLEDGANAVFGGMTDAITDFAVTGKFEFKQLADSMIRDLLRIAMQAHVVRPLMNMTNSFAAGIFGGGGISPNWQSNWATTYSPAGFASGGAFRVPGSGGGDRPTLVGLSPGELVQITPQHKVSSDSGQMVQNVIIQSSREFETQERERQGPGGIRIQEIIVSEVSKAIGRGDLDMPFESRFGNTPRTSRR